MCPRRPVEVPPSTLHEARDLVGDVLVVGLEGPDRQEVPEDLIRLGPACLRKLGEEQEAHLGLAVQLEGHEDEGPHPHDLRVMA